MNNKDMQALLSSWDIGSIDRTENIPSYWNGAVAVTVANGERFVLKTVNSDHDIDREISLLSHLKKHGVPVPSLVQCKSGKFSTDFAGRVYVLYTWINGESVGNHYRQGANKRAKSYGKAIGLLHRGLADWQMAGNAHRLDLRAEVDRCVSLVDHQHDVAFDVEKIRYIAAVCLDGLHSIQHQLPEQWIHRDLHPGNMLFLSGKLSGIIDFDMVQKAPRMFDPCYCATSILISGWGEPRNRERWLPLFRDLIAGYEEQAPISPVEKKAFYLVMSTIEFMFMAFAIGRGEINHALCNQNVLFWLHDNRSRIE